MPEHAFICDNMLGRLARNLRMLGFDALYARNAKLQEMIRTAAAENRILLTRREAPLKAFQGIQLVCIASNDPAKQLRHVLIACGCAKNDFHPFTRCLRCNAVLVPAERQAAEHRVPQYIAETIDAFGCCPICGRIYWKGSHYDHMLQQCSGFAIHSRNTIGLAKHHDRGSG